MSDRLANLELPANQRAAEEAGTTMEAIAAPFVVEHMRSEVYTEFKEDTLNRLSNRLSRHMGDLLVSGLYVKNTLLFDRHLVSGFFPGQCFAYPYPVRSRDLVAMG